MQKNQCVTAGSSHDDPMCGTGTGICGRDSSGRNGSTGCRGKGTEIYFPFIGDGMSYPQIQTTNYYLNAIEDDGDDILTSESKLNMMKFPVAGSAQTYDSTSFCPDSASTATSISTGHKTYSGTINMDEKMETSYETIAEKLKNSLAIRWEFFPQ